MKLELPPLPVDPAPKRERVLIDLRKRKLDMGPLTAIKLERGLDTWMRNYCMVSGRTIRSVIEEGLNKVRAKVERREREG